MAQTLNVALDAHFGTDQAPDAGNLRAVLPAALDKIDLSVHDDLLAIEQDWRSFEARADCTVFQTFDWLTTWQRHVGLRNGVTPAIVMGRDVGGNILFLLPLSIRAAGFARELAWLGSDLCDYNAPLLAENFSKRVDAARFVELWKKIIRHLQSHPRYRFDYFNLTKMPEQIGAQSNPMLHLSVTMNANGAHLTQLTGDWETFYNAKRTSSSRKRDRTKRKKLSEFGEMRLSNSESQEDIARTLDILVDQKTRSFARMGVANLFARPGHADFFRAIAIDPAMKPRVHLSKLNVGATPAASNLGLTYRGRYYHLLTSYDDGDMSRYGPGAIHLQELMHLAIDRGFDIFDFTIGDEPYKRDWCDTELKLYDFVAAATWRGALFAVPMLAKQRLKRWIKQTPALWKVFSGARALLGAVKRPAAH
jgi:CelD/BcsL family acetyltransferase involved in cellulose biosynthesis